jgi:hypothetical protein
LIYLNPAFNRNIGAWNTASVSNMCCAFEDPARQVSQRKHLAVMQHYPEL